jgi:hypothetical protein
VVVDVGQIARVTRAVPISRNLLPSVVAHELAHGSNVKHHGDADYEVQWVENSDGSGRLKDPWVIAAPGGGHSGVQECLMRSNIGANFFETPGGRYRWRKSLTGGRESLDYVYGERYPPFEKPGTLFCSIPGATGVNAPGGFTLPDGRKVSKAGNATRGACQKQFCVNDIKSCKQIP